MIDDATITPVQCRMARAALDWSVRELARMAGVATSAVAAFESGASTGVSDPFRRKLVAAVTDAGLILVAESSHEGPGVRLSKTFVRGFIYDDQGRHVASILGEGVYDIVRGDRLATVREDGRLYGLDGAALGPLRMVDVFNQVGSLSADDLRRLFARERGGEALRLTAAPPRAATDPES